MVMALFAQLRSLNWFLAGIGLNDILWKIYDYITLMELNTTSTWIVETSLHNSSTFEDCSQRKYFTINKLLTETAINLQAKYGLKMKTAYNRNI